MDHRDNQNPNKQPDPGYTYVQGLGFVPYGPAHRERIALITAGNALGLAVLLYLFLRASLPAQIVRLFQLLHPGIRYFNSHMVAEEWAIQLAEGLCFLLCMVVAYGLYMLFIRIPPRAAFPFRKAPVSMVVAAVFIGLAVSVLGSLATATLGRVFRLAGLIPITPDVTVSATPVGLAAALANVCALPALLEECVYRGVIMQSLRRFGDGFALVASAVIFSILHLNLAQAPIALLMGLVIGYFVLRTGSLWTGVLMHFCNNFLALVQQYALSRVAPGAAEVANTLIVLLYLVLGLVSTILLSRGTDDLFRLNTVPSAYTMRKRCRMFFACPAMVVALVLILSIAVQSIQLLR